MLPKDLIRHAREFCRLFRNHKYEFDDDGRVLFANAKAVFHGEFSHGDGLAHGNTWTNAGLDYVLTIAMNNGTREAGFYFAPFANNFQPSRTTTMAQFPNLAGEFVSPTLGYSETTRRQWQPIAPVNGFIEAPEASLTAATDGSAGSKITILGMGLTTRSAKGATDGILIAAAKYSDPYSYYNGNKVPLQYKLTLFPQ